MSPPDDRGYGERRSADSVSELLGPRGYCVWLGTSGRRFTHTIYTLVGCPAPFSSSWVLVRRDETGGAIALATGVTKDVAPTLNLAEIRRIGAVLAAEEVHVCASSDPGALGNLQAAAIDIAAASGVASHVEA